MPTMRERMTSRLAATLAPESLEVIDESESHRGHAGWREGGETHFRLRLRAPRLAPLGRVQRHRAVHAALGPEILQQIHALAIEIET
jgi:BolA protein